MTSTKTKGAKETSRQAASRQPRRRRAGRRREPHPSCQLEHQRHPLGLSRFLRQERPRGGALGAARAAPRSDLDVHQCRHGAVQERVHRRREAEILARGLGAEMRARRRQAQRPRQCRLYRPPPHLLRDARQFLLRRLFQGARDPARLGAAHQGPRARQEPPAHHRVRRRRRGGGAMAQDRGAARREDHSHRRLRQFLVDGRHRPVRPVLGDLLRPWARRSPAARPAAPTPTATASSRSGISCSCNTSSFPAASASTCPSLRSIPAWGSSASPRCCKAPTTTTPSICSAR